MGDANLEAAVSVLIVSGRPAQGGCHDSIGPGRAAVPDPLGRHVAVVRVARIGVQGLKDVNDERHRLHEVDSANLIVGKGAAGGAARVTRAALVVARADAVVLHDARRGRGGLNATVARAADR